MSPETKSAGVATGVSSSIMILVGYLAPILLHVTIPGNVIAAAIALLAPFVHGLFTGTNKGTPPSSPNANGMGNG